jgi:phosphoribosylanthranilate isomerase
MRIKVCGITRREDGAAAAGLGVHALGFVLWAGSPRAIPLDRVADIVGALPPFVTPVGVFVDPTEVEVARARDAGIQMAQVHGQVPPLPPGLPLLRAVHLSSDGSSLEPETPGTGPVIIDAFDPVRRGGTGRTVDWARVRPIARQRPVVLAGGLTADNVRTAIAEARPYGVDVSSGVERAPGIKDHDKLAAFVAAVGRHA